MAAISALAGDELYVKRGGDLVAVPTATAIGSAKFVAFYFSAHWCPPCRGFTPVLAEAFSAQGADPEVAVVFVSSDEDEKSFKSYYNAHPWAAIPYDAAARQALGVKYGVRGIPSLVVVNALTGEIVTKDGRSIVAAAPVKSLRGLFH